MASAPAVPRFTRQREVEDEQQGAKKAGYGKAVLKELWEDKNLLESKGAAAKNYVYSNAGATAKIIRFIQEKRLLTS